MDRFSYLADVSPSWQGPQVDDGIDEGFPLHGVVQKGMDGLLDYTLPGGYYYDKWKAQHDSIKHFSLLLSYHYFRTKFGGKEQACLFAEMLDRNGYAGGAVDFEGVGNDIDEDAVWKLVEYVAEFDKVSSKKLLVYVNKSTFKFIKDVLRLGISEEYANKWIGEQTWWIAGGLIYNQKLYALPSNEYDPFPQIPWTILQFSADKNELADELDFSENEKEDIDYNRVRMSPEMLHAFFGLAYEPSVPQTENTLPTESSFFRHWLEGLEIEILGLKDRIAKLEDGTLPYVIPATPDVPAVPAPAPVVSGVLRIASGKLIAYKKYKFNKNENNPYGGRWIMRPFKKIPPRPKVLEGQEIYVITEPKETFDGGAQFAKVIRSPHEVELVGHYVRCDKLEPLPE